MVVAPRTLHNRVHSLSRVSSSRQNDRTIYVITAFSVRSQIGSLKPFSGVIERLRDGLLGTPAMDSQWLGVEGATPRSRGLPKVSLLSERVRI
jgi:hypothetical protein